MGKIPQESLLSDDGVRSDGRRVDEARPFEVQVGVLTQANGSALVKQGKNLILAGVIGPYEAERHSQYLDRGVLRTRYHMQPYSTNERKSPTFTRREIELSRAVREALEPAVILTDLPRAQIDVFIEVLQADGGTRCASVNAASVALADAGVPMRDLVTAVAIGKVRDTLVVDINDLEDENGQADFPIAMMPSKDKITLLQMNGLLTQEEIHKSIEMARGVIRSLYEVQVEALKRRYAPLAASGNREGGSDA
ncbi:MAG: exosome complex exonuclease Rrp41 [Thermoprotei archaeon]|nr:exosome complex exonuclease Rrp41 [TACK group archaeon]